MYTGSNFNWYDQSEITITNDVVNQIDNSPLFMVVGSFDKGPEDLREVSGRDFNSLYGSRMYFERHGQNAIQAQRIIDAGGRILIKRVCADDATLANMVMIAHVTATEVQKKNEFDQLLYLDSSDHETTTAEGNTPVMINAASIRWESRNITGCKSFEEVKSNVLNLLDEATGTYPVMFFTDNGRGVSSKAIRLIPDYSTSKNIGKMFYTATIFEGTKSIDSNVITFDPTVIYSGVAYGLDKSSLTQVKGEIIAPIYESLVDKIADITGETNELVRNQDIIYGYSYKGDTLANISIDRESVDINSDYGIEIKEGSDGEFGSAPVNTEAWVEAIRKVYAGEVTDEVWDVDQYKIAAICDANFPPKIKEAIANFVTFRKDCVFFRDYGLGLDSFLKIRNYYSSLEIKNNFIADYATSYMVKDPVTLKNINVTMMYDLVECLTTHLSTSPYNPLAGTANGFILREAIKGTLNYVPIKTPSTNQKQAMDDIRVNYAIFEDDNCVVQSLYSTQKKYTQLSYINNTLAIQEVARAVRTACPKQRFTLTTGMDLTSYAKAVSNVLSNFTGHFTTLEFVYTQDKLKVSQKIFYATIRFGFGDWAQTEVFDLFAINNE